MGLTTVRRVAVTLHGGAGRVSSRPGRTCIEVRLPLAGVQG